VNRFSARTWIAIVAILVGVGLLAGGYLLLRGSSRTAVPQPAQLLPATTFPSPSKQIPDGTRIKVADLGIDLPLVAGDGVNAPLYKAATVPALSIPGEGHRSMVYAHAQDRMFGPLFRAKVGESVELDYPGGAVLRYRINEYYPRWSSTDLKWLQPLDHEELILLTCTTYNANDPRIIAVAEPQ
jgi:LPXTG-site transpeptidase (sortase) family protein